jgi:hypothetical protein
MEAVDYADFRALAEMSPDAGHLLVHFTMEAVKNPLRSKEAGRPIYENVEFIRIFTPKDKDTVIHRQATEEDRQRFAAEYNRWLQKREAPETGIPLSSWAAVDRAQVQELGELKPPVRTVEGLAKLSDALAAKFPELEALRQRARDYLEQAEGAAPVEKLRAELQERDAELQQLRRMLKEQSEALAEMKKQLKKQAA